MDVPAAAALVLGIIFILASPNEAAQQFSGMFVFGDSLVDDGNNNFLSSLAKANYLPYGIDFYEGPSGRFCNGKTIIDFLGNFLFSHVFVCVNMVMVHIPIFFSFFSQTLSLLNHATPNHRACRDSRDQQI
jgi:phospholipase/lecithinase/hemolysin